MQYLLLLLVSICFLVVKVSSWTWSSSSRQVDNIGPKVSGHSCSVASTNPDKLILFGGLTGSGGSPTTANLWKYEQEDDDSTDGGSSESRRRWDLLPRNVQGISRPGRRMYSASAVLAGDNTQHESFYLFGGWDPEEPGSGGKFLSDIWRFSLKTNKWDLCSAFLPFPVSRHSACAIGPDDIVIYTHKGILLFSFDGRDWSVSEQSTTGDGPDGLSMCATCGISNGYSSSGLGQDLLVFGGSTQAQELSSATYVLCTQSWTWRKLVVDDDQQDFPAPLASSCASNVIGRDNQCVIFGGATVGETGLIPQRDTWLLTVNGDSAEWKKIAVGGEDDDDDDDDSCRPEGRVAASLTAIGDEIILQGGYDPVTKETYDQTWVLSQF
jgi:hypothetical protein